MSLVNGTLYEVLTSAVIDNSGTPQVLTRGQLILGSKLPAAAEPLVIAAGSTEAEKTAARRSISPAA
jgi:hypothetical protein